MEDYERVELYPSIEIGAADPRPRFVAALDDWKYTFEIHGDVVGLVEITRPWRPGDPSPPDWVPAAADERVTVDEYTRADVPAPVVTALLAQGVLGHDLSLRIR